jgi:Spy/CpxP family protein refolding chaperone
VDAAAIGARFDALKAQLKITAAQEAAWQGYVSVVQQHAEQLQALRTQMQAQMHDPQAAATVDRAAFHDAMWKLREQQWTERDAALKGLYEVLTPEQKSLAEQRLAYGPGHRMAMRGWGR